MSFRPSTPGGVGPSGESDDVGSRGMIGAAALTASVVSGAVIDAVWSRADHPTGSNNVVVMSHAPIRVRLPDDIQVV